MPEDIGTKNSNVAFYTYNLAVRNVKKGKYLLIPNRISILDLVKQPSMLSGHHC